MPKELDHLKKGLINFQNFNDNEYFKWCLVRYLHPADYHPEKMRKIVKLFGDDLGFEVNIKYIHKIEKKKSISISVLGYEDKEKYY